MSLKNKKNSQSKDNKKEEKFTHVIYMTPNKVTAKDLFVILSQENDTVELWEAMDILEIGLANHKTIDIEPLPNKFKDPSDIAFVAEHGINTLFSIMVDEEDLSTLKSYFEKVIHKYDGFLCTDSVDFSPILLGVAKKVQ